MDALTKDSLLISPQNLQRLLMFENPRSGCTYSVWIVSGTLHWIHILRITSASYGTSALSPSGRRLAVANLGRGIDWFSFSHGRFMSTSNYFTQGRDAAILITNLAFVDEDTVVVGHCAGTLNFVSFGMSENPFTLPISTSRELIHWLKRIGWRYSSIDIAIQTLVSQIMPDTLI